MAALAGMFHIKQIPLSDFCTVYNAVRVLSLLSLARSDRVHAAIVVCWTAVLMMIPSGMYAAQSMRILYGRRA